MNGFARIMCDPRRKVVKQTNKNGEQSFTLFLIKESVLPSYAWKRMHFRLCFVLFCLEGLCKLHAVISKDLLKLIGFLTQAYGDSDESVCGCDFRYLLSFQY